MRKKSNKMKILLTRRLHDVDLRALRKNYDVEIYSGRIPMPKNVLNTKIRNKDGLICFPYDIIDKEIIDSAKHLKCISTYSVGYDHIDVKHCKKKKIRIGYTPNVLTAATADLAFSLILDVMRRVTEGDRIIRKGKWSQIFGAYDYVGLEVTGKTLGVLGLGRIGKQVAKRAKGFDMKVIYHNRKKLSQKDEKVLDAKKVSLNELFKKSDVISVHIPYSKETHEIINKKLLRQMKKNSCIINTSRGKIIKETDLILVLKQKLIAGAGLDVYYTEPISKSNPLTKMDNVVLAPHIGSSTIETRKKMAELTVKNLELGLKSRKLIYAV